MEKLSIPFINSKLIFLRLREVGGHPEEEEGPGVYLHIIWTQQGKFWLYVGQSVNIRERIRKHCDEQYRKRHPSLHYSVWESHDVVGDIWVTLSRFPDSNLLGDSSIFRPTLEERALLLNLQEAYMSCVLQTLRRHHLERYLPENTFMPWAGSHLNLALPQWQGFSTQSGEVVTRQTFIDALHSSDPALRKWAASWRNCYNTLRDSPDPRLRGYWAQNMADMRNRDVSAAHKGKQKAKMERYRQLLDSGGTARIHQDKRTDRLFFVWGEDHFVFPILNALRALWPCKAGDLVHFRPLLFQEPQKVPFARKALATDPASRLIIAAKVERDGKDFWAWPFTHGQRAVLGMNYFVDCLEGLSLTQSRLLPRRLTTRYNKDGKKTLELSDAEAPSQEVIAESLLREINTEDLLP